MEFGKLSESFADHARSLQEAKDKTARFRATSYMRVAELIDSKYEASEPVSKEKIDELGLTAYMVKKANEIIDGKTLKLVKTKSKRAKSPIKTVAKKAPKVKNGKTKSTSRSRSSSKSPSKNRSRSPSKSPSKNKSPNKPIDKEALMKELTNFMGIGEERAKQLISEGLTKINQLHMKKWLAKLPEETQLFLKLKPSDKIPHEDIQALEPYLNKLQNDDMKIYLVGSYRRKKATSSDIDVMLVSEAANIIETFMEDLKKSLSGKAYPYSKGKDKLSIIVDLSDILNKPAIYKLDAFRVEPKNAAPMLLYSTGSKTFNITMRGIAKRKGYLLNQNGLFKRDGTELTPVPDLKTEKDYFDILDIDYKEPQDRI
jgi:DNA polymerase/3'-5' exonuclease PolX